MLVFHKRRFGSIILCLVFAPIFVDGQDLGSSTNLLKTTTKKTTSKKKSPTVSKKRTRSTTTIKTAANTNKKTGVAKPPVAEKTLVPKAEKKVDIRPATLVLVNAGEAITGNLEEKFERAIESGNRQRDQRNYDAAESSYLRAQALKSNDWRAIYGLGNLFSDQGRWEESERAYRSAIQIDPSFPEPFVALSFVLTQPVEGTNLTARYSEAEKLSRRAIELDSENAVAFDQLGVALELQGNVSDETQTFYQKAVKLDPTFALAYAHLGRLLRKKGLVEASTAAYINSIQYSVDVPTMILVAEVLQSQQRYPESEQLLKRALREDEKNPTGLYLLGKALTTRGNFEEAESVLKKSAEVSPKSFVSYTLLASLYLRQGKLEAAESSLEKAAKVVSQNENRRLSFEFESVGDGYLEAGKAQDAVRIYRKALSLDAKRVDLVEKMNKIKTVSNRK